MGRKAREGLYCLFTLYRVVAVNGRLVAVAAAPRRRLFELKAEDTEDNVSGQLA